MPQPRLDELFLNYLKQRSAVAARGPIARESEVETHQAVAFAVVDCRQAFRDALAAAEWLIARQAAAALRDTQMPPGWDGFVHQRDSIVAIPFCMGHYPQMLRDVTPILANGRPSSLLAETQQPQPMNDVVAWGTSMLPKQKWAEAIVAAAVLRMTGQSDAARDILDQVRISAPVAWNAVLLNEEAALAWAAGDLRKAGDLWAKHPSADTPPILFNRGLVALLTDRPRDAESLLWQAVNKLPETSAWHHLAHLYLALARK
jgi:hypothetical protein